MASLFDLPPAERPAAMTPEDVAKLVERLRGALLFSRRDDDLGSVCPVRHDDAETAAALIEMLAARR